MEFPVSPDGHELAAGSKDLGRVLGHRGRYNCGHRGLSEIRAALKTFSAGALLFLCCAPLGAREKTVKPSPSEIEALARYVLPKGWEVEKDGSGADPALRVTRGRHIIRIRLFGGRGSRYAAPADFLSGFQATTMGHPPEKAGQVKLSGRAVVLYKHGYPIDLGDPHLVDPAPPKLAREHFCILPAGGEAPVASPRGERPWRPAGGRFFVLSYAYEEAIPDLSDEGDRAWAAFLKSFTLKMVDHGPQPP